MSRKEEYKLRNEQFLKELEHDEGIQKLPSGVYYKIVEKGTGVVHPKRNSVVTVHYYGRLVSGKEFDNSWKRGVPEAFRVSQLIVGWQIALMQMCVGDRWQIYIPYELGYGTRTNGPIPGCSTLIFEVHLIGIA